MYPNLAPYACIALLCASVYSLLVRSRRQRLPPGPTGFPFVGNAFQIPKEFPEYTYAAWAKTYGSDLIYTEAFGHRAIIITSQRIAQELLEKRGANYSSRPRLVMLVELLGWHPSVPFLPYRSESRRKQSRWMRNAFGEKNSVQSFDRLKERETYIFLLGVMETPNDYVLHTKRFLAALVVEAVYGHQITSLEDKYINLMDRAMEGTVATGEAGATLIDILPFLKHVPAWMPGAAFKRAALHTRSLLQASNEVPYRMVKEAIGTGNARRSYVSTLVENAEKAGRINDDETDIMWSAVTVYGAATDTTKTALLTFLLAMVLYPEVFGKAQEEVDRVVGKDRLPNLGDRPDLPYLECVLRETYRRVWHPPIPLGIAHYTTADDEYNGYYIPKDAAVVVNMWAICRDERIWDNPDVFRPERFLNSTSSDAGPIDPRNIIFGYGRRLCPGRLFADTTLFVAMANIVATLNISKACDADTKMSSETLFLPGFISYPKPFGCNIAPRSSASKTLVSEALANVDT
ncbi:cytochrome P450 [Daedalea quercina L-15889]|uniref:Cytochrome P450 n=1 Tax=Daedalea quercina L-15889 TaxID=1314783 RepID=A0A165PRZ2_9APHY|nr:cytochrome P450 [Daedalea quercina L-15889]